MSYDTTEYTAHDENGNATSTVNVHVVTDSEDGDQVNTTGGSVTVHAGQLLVQGGNPNFWDVFNADDFAKLGYADGEPVAEPALAEPDAVPPEA